RRRPLVTRVSRASLDELDVVEPEVDRRQGTPIRCGELELDRIEFGGVQRPARVAPTLLSQFVEPYRVGLPGRGDRNRNPVVIITSRVVVRPRDALFALGMRVDVGHIEPHFHLGIGLGSGEKANARVRRSVVAELEPVTYGPLQVRTDAADTFECIVVQAKGGLVT